jgi:hypothetical protein
VITPAIAEILRKAAYTDVPIDQAVDQAARHAKRYGVAWGRSEEIAAMAQYNAYADTLKEP